MWKRSSGVGRSPPGLQRERLDSVRSIDVSNPASAEYGLALARFGPMLGHDGSLPGFQSFMGHDPGPGPDVDRAHQLGEHARR